jgi:hypothetical protein
MNNIMTEAEIERFIEYGELSDELYDKLFEYYVNSGDMPYGTAKARDGDPYQWICDTVDYELTSAFLWDLYHLGWKRDYSDNRHFHYYVP